MKNNIIFILLIFLNLTALAQRPGNYIKAGDESFNAGNYYGASLMYKKALDKDSKNLKTTFKYAEACRLNRDYENAAKFFEQIIKKDPSNHLAFFWLGDVYKSLGKYKEANKNYTIFIKKYPDTDYFTVKAKHETEICNRYLTTDSLPTYKKEIEVKSIGNKANTYFSEFGLFPFNDTLIYYSSPRPSKNDSSVYIVNNYKSIYNEDQWNEGKLIDSIFNSVAFHSANIFVNINADLIYFSRCYQNNTKNKGKASNCQIWQSKKVEGRWNEPEILPNSVNYPGSKTTQPYVLKTKSKEYLLFSSDRDSSFGGMDIWFAEIIGDKKFGTAHNFGPTINTIDDEVTPFYSLKDSTLYFASKWNNSLGGFDIFKSKGFFNKWQIPINLGIPVNSSYDDLYFITDKSYKTAYFSSNRKGSISNKGESCCNDNYFFKLPFDSVPPIKSDSINLTQLEKPVSPDLTKIDTMKKEIILKQILHKDSIQENVTILKRYDKIDSLLFQKKTDIPVKFKKEENAGLILYFGNDEPDPKTFNKTSTLNYIQLLTSFSTQEYEYLNEYSKGMNGSERKLAEMEVHNFFNNSIKTLDNDLKNLVEKIEGYLLNKQNITLLLKAYCSPLSTSDYNYLLAQRRISSVINYLVGYKKGTLQAYIDNKNLIIKTLPLGDKFSFGKISKDPRDKRNSIYSPLAAKERKVEIIVLFNE